MVVVLLWGLKSNRFGGRVSLSGKWSELWWMFNNVWEMRLVRLPL